ncbi:hypothetical protein MBRU_12170 [Mycolicibacterium brumae DSM 44177]|nr:hypothetical protein MBRU_12170 [Mycolicibacterium brumae DSM 44177]
MTTTARELAREHVSNGGHVAVLIPNEHHEREWDGLDRALVTTARDLMESRIADESLSERLSLPRQVPIPLLLVIDPADHLTREQWEQVGRIAERGRGRGTGVSVVVTAHRLSSVPRNLLDECELVELERRAA